MKTKLVCMKSQILIKRKQIMRYIYLGVRSIEHCNVLSEKIISQPTVPAESPFSEQIIYKLMYR